MPCKNHPWVEEPLYRCARCNEAFCSDCIVQIGGYLYCAQCKLEAMGDLRAGVSVQQLELASVGRRFGALILDGLVLTIPTAVIIGLVVGGLAMRGGGLKSFDPNQNMGMFLLFEGGLFFFSFALWVTYEGLMLSRGGQTLGKKALSLKVVTADGGEITKGQAWMRGVARQGLGLVPCLGLVNYLLAFGQDRTCLHDILVKTRVVDWNR